MVVKDKTPVEENGGDALKQQQQQVNGAPTAPSWMSQRKKRRGIKAKRAARGSKKRFAKEASNDDENDDVADEEEQGKQAPTLKPGRPSGRPFPFQPSAALQLVMKRRSVLRRTAVSSDLAARLRTMQCPFLWEADTAPKDLTELYRQLEDTPHRATPWHVAVRQIHQAYEFARHRMVWKSRELLEDVYSLLAEAQLQAQGDDDALVNKYKEGLKHVLDSCWLLVREDHDASTGVPLPDGTAPEHVTEFDALNNKQKASVWAIRAMMSVGNVRAAERALNLDGSEGQWLYVKAASERAVRARKLDVDVGELTPRYTAEEVESFRKACDRRKNPQTLLRLADCYLNGPTEDHQLCTKLVREALDRFPLSAYAQLKSALIFFALSRNRKDKDSRSADVCYNQAVHLARSWPQANLEYGLYCKHVGNMTMALHYLASAGDLALCYLL